MPRKTLVLIVLLVVVTGLLLFIALRPQSTQKQLKQIALRSTPSPTPFQKAVLSFSPDPVLVSSGSSSVDAVIDTGGNRVTAVQLELKYDPTALSQITITPSTFIPNATVLIKKIDTVNGRISYAVGIPPKQTPLMGTGTVATIRFVLSDTAKQTTIDFLPKTLVTAEGLTPSVLKSTKGVAIMRSQAQGTQSPQGSDSSRPAQ